MAFLIFCENHLICQTRLGRKKREKGRGKGKGIFPSVQKNRRGGKKKMPIPFSSFLIGRRRMTGEERGGKKTR